MENLEALTAEKAAVEKAAEVELAKIKANQTKAVKAERVITATEAKHLADTSEIIKKRINKLIREAAEEGILETNYGTYHPSMTLLKGIEADLLTRGFEVNIIPDKEEPNYVTMVISWDDKQ